MAHCDNPCDVDSQDLDTNDGYANLTTEYCTYTTPSGYSLGSYAQYENGSLDSRTNFNMSVSGTGYAASGVQILGMGAIIFSYIDGDNPSNYATNLGCYGSGQRTMHAFDCHYQICALSFEGFAYTLDEIQYGALRSSPLNYIGRPQNQVDSSIGILEPLDPDFPGNHTYVMNIDNLASMKEAAFDLFGYTILQAASLSDKVIDVADLTSILGGIGNAMTYRIMQGPNSIRVYGNILQNDTFIHVQWVWLSLSLVLEVITTVLLLTTILLTRRAQQLVWKSKLAPLLYSDSGLSGFERAQWMKLKNGSLQKAKTVRVDAIRIWLTKNSNGTEWKE